MGSRITLGDHADARVFLRVAEPLLLAHEPEYAQLLATMQHDVDSDRHGRVMATVHAHGELVGVARLGRNGQLLTTRLTDAAASLLAAHIEARLVAGAARPRACERASLRFMVADARTCRAFCRAFERNTGRPTRLRHGLRLYVLRELVSPPGGPPHERLVLAGPEHVAVVTHWLESFVREVGLEDEQDWTALAWRKIENRSLYLLTDGTRPLSMAAWAHPTAHGIRINFVYTPPAFRGRGLATRSVAALVRHLLAQGRSFCALYADRSNATANHVYRSLGFVASGNVDEREFLHAGSSAELA